jgi:transcriptional regulator with XRE-family HTH domain
MPIAGIRARIRQRLDDLSLSMEKASKDAGLSEAYLKQLMSERQDDITASKLEALAPVLKTTAAWLLTGEGDASVQPDKETAAVFGIVHHLNKKNLAAAAHLLQALRDSQKPEKKGKK